MRAVITESLVALAAPINTLTLDPENANRGDVAAIQKSLNVFGQRKPVVVRRTGHDADGRPTGIVVAGNHTLMAATELGWDHVAAVFIDDDESTAKAYALADNRTGELSSWDNDQLAASLRDLTADDFDMTSLGWSEDELAALLLGEEATEVDADDPDERDVPEPPAVPVSVVGDLWHLGRHRLLCGDATDPAHLDAVLADVGTPGIVYTDPPYGISIVSGGSVGAAGAFGGRKNRKADGSNVIAAPSNYLPVAGDATTDAAADAFRLLHATYPGAWHIWWGGNHYAASAGLPDASRWLVWDKDNIGNTFADAELAWTNRPGPVRVLRHQWQGMIRATERGQRFHPTQKPVALAEWAFGVVDKDASRLTVLDAFGGSGSTLLAAERTGRAAAVIEIEPAYVDVICRRYQEHSGILPVLASTGEPHDFIAQAEQRAENDRVEWP